MPNLHSERAVSRASEVLAWLASRGVEGVFSHSDATALGDTVSAPEAADRTGWDMAVALGGDGTILKTVRLLEDAEVPVLGVHLGNLGFMSGATEDDMFDALESALAGEARIERRMTLRVEAQPDSGPRVSRRALNEVFLGRGGGARSVAVAVALNGAEVGRYRCDGVVVATPTGSTAYALSAGGPVVSPDVRAVLVLPVAAHAVGTRPLLAGPSDLVEVAFTDPARSDGVLMVDGEPFACPEGPVRSLSVTRHASDVLLVRHDARGFFEAYRDEFLGS